MSSKITCPICQESFTEKGMKTHKGSKKCQENAKKLAKTQPKPVEEVKAEEQEMIPCPFCNVEFPESDVHQHIEKCEKEDQETAKEILSEMSDDEDIASELASEIASEIDIEEPVEEPIVEVTNTNFDFEFDTSAFEIVNSIINEVIANISVHSSENEVSASLNSSIENSAISQV